MVTSIGSLAKSPNRRGQNGKYHYRSVPSDAMTGSGLTGSVWSQVTTVSDPSPATVP
jgi:hypothetical protein